VSTNTGTLGNRSTAPGSSHPDPTGERRFRVEIGGVTIGEFAECTGLSVEYEVFEYQEGGENRFVHKLRGRAKHPNLVLKRGVTHEDALLKWFQDCQDKTARKEGLIALMGPDAKPVRAWAFAGAFPVKWQGPTMNAGSSNIATETLEIVHQGFQPTKA
jgi:phage tail-like protein